MLAPEALAPALPATFCSLRWRYLQCDLAHGQVKACCKTPFVDVSDADIATHGDRVVFNHPHFVSRRREMLAGVAHADCVICHEHEAAGIVSYRMSESRKPIFATPDSMDVATAELDDAWPTHIELILSTTCDLSCAYCDPRFSSAWAAETRASPPGEALTAIDEGRSPAAGFKASFESWFRKALPRLRYLQFNGGEPLLQKEFHRYLDLIAAERGRLQVGVITNLNTPDVAFRRFIDRLPQLMADFDIRIGVSQEAVGARAEYVRYGLQWSRFETNLRRLVDTLDGRALHLAPTMSALNLTSFDAYVDFIENLVEQHGANFFWRPSLVHAPVHLSPLVAGADERRALAHLTDRLRQSGRWPDLRAWLERLTQAIGRCADLPQRRHELSRWIARHDRRRKTDFATVFPELDWLCREQGGESGAA